MKKTALVLIVSFLSLFVLAQIPAGYYDSAEGETGDTKRESLYNIIKGHSSKSYNSLHNYYYDTDKKSNGKVWDMYSDVPGGTSPYEFTFGDKCGNYNSENDCYNREHSFPKSWFDNSSPMSTDIFHVVPTDGYVNGMRGSLAYGEVGTVEWTSQNGTKKGFCSFPGCYGTVFEPIDAYKGDFARIYFYMLTRYYDKISGWSSYMLSDNNFSDWAKNMLLKWHANDPVSQKEIDRNNEIYKNIQHNRNPFVDHPEYANDIWGYYNPTDIKKIVQKIDFNIAPNPVKDNFTIAYNLKSASIVNITICSLDGKQKTILNESKQNTGSHQLDFSINDLDLQKGLYLIYFQTNKATNVKKIIIN